MNLTQVFDKADEGCYWRDHAAEARYDAAELARLSRISLRQLQREFRRVLGRSPQDWLDEEKLIAAGALLRSGEQVKTVALDLGWKQTSHFCRQFKDFYKKTPGEFAREGAPAKPCRSQITVVAGR